MRRLLLLLVPLAVVAAACGDDDAGDGDDAAPVTTVAEPGDDPAEREVDDDSIGTTDTTTPETALPDATAEERPDQRAGEGEGLDDPGVLLADLTGEAEVPGPGASGASGRFEAELIDGALCVDMVVTELDATVTAAHLHDGAAAANGPPVVDLGAPTSADDGGATWSDVCVPVEPALVEGMVVEPQGHYADVHTATFPDGAARGQLELGSIFDRTLP